MISKQIHKRLILIVFLIMMAFSLCACGSVNSMVVTNPDGSINEVVIVNLDVLTNSDYLSIKTDAIRVAKLEADAMKSLLNTKIDVEFLTNGITEENAYLESYRNGIQFVSNLEKPNQMILGVQFKNEEVYKYYYGITNDSSSESVVEKGFLFNKVIYHGSSIYVKHNSIYLRLSDYFSKKYPDLINLEEAEISYTRVSELRREHSNANYVTQKGGKFYHTWVYNAAEVQDYQSNEIYADIMIYYNVANRSNWILLSIGLSLIVCFIMLVVSIIISKIKKTQIKNKLNNKNNENNIKII